MKTPCRKKRGVPLGKGDKGPEWSSPLSKVQWCAAHLIFRLLVDQSHFLNQAHASACISELNSCGVSYIRVRHLSGIPAFL